MTRRQAITLLDVARAAQVSRATASLVVRNAPVVAAATRARVEQAMRDLGYVYNRNAAGLRASRSGVIGILIPNISNPFFAEFLEGVESVLQAAGQTTFLVTSGDEREREGRALRLLLERGCDGVVLCPSQDVEANLVEDAGRSGIPIVQAMRRVSDAFDYVGPDYAAGMALVVAHLAQLGHRRFAFLSTGLRHSAAREREQALLDICARSGLPEPELIVTDTANAGDDAVIAAIRHHRKCGLSAAICFNDTIALRLCCALADQGIAIGQEISVTGFDGVGIARSFRPRLTTVDIRPGDIGAAVAKRLIFRLGAPTEPALRTVMPVALLTGQTTGQEN